MKRLLKLTAVILFVITHSKAQNSDFLELKTQISNISKLLKEVVSKDETIRQELTTDPTKVYRLVLTKTTTDKKGKSKAVKAEFNLSDMDVNAVSFNTQGVLAYLKMYTDRRQSLIRVSENDKYTGFDSELQLLGNQLDDVRGLSDAVKKAIPLARDAYTKLRNLPKTMMRQPKD